MPSRPIREGGASLPHPVQDPRLALFTTCKAFTGTFHRIQTNAIGSWRAADPGIEILVFGDELGVAEQCSLHRLTQVPSVPRSEQGTPLLDGLFAGAEQSSSADVFGYVNADIMLTRDVVPVVRRVCSEFEQFLLIARRWNLALDEPWDFSDPLWDVRLKEYARTHGVLEPVYGGMDLFVYRRGLWRDLPAFAIGRGRWDSALIFIARKQRIPVIDVTPVLVTVHQNHDYSHVTDGAVGAFKGPDGRRNESLLGGEEFIFTALNATHVLTESGIRRQVDWYPPHVLRRLATLPALHPSLRPLSPLVKLLSPTWRRLAQSSRLRKEERRIARRHPASAAPTTSPLEGAGQDERRPGS